MKTRISIITAAIFAAFITTASAGPGAGSSWTPNGFPTRVTTEKQAMECCLPKEKVAMACKDCKTVTEKSGDDKKGVAAWFKPDSMHDCSGCGGKITVKAGSAKGGPAAEYKHVCSKCGENSAVICATHTKS